MLTQVIQDNDLFNGEAFKESLSSNKTPLTLFKESIRSGNLYLVDQFEMGKPIEELVHKRAWFIDQILTQVWEIKISDPSLALIAVGGYGRGELHPFSDIDIMILQKTRTTSSIKSQIENFITFLWDIGLEVGHSVRTVNDCTREAKSDITVATNLMESRLLTGNAELFESMQKATGPKKIWPARKFFEAKWKEQQARHQRFDGTEHNLEPNIKEGPGGLRDLQMIAWVAKRHFGSGDLEEFVDQGFLTKDEYRVLHTGCLFLWRIRFALHIIAERREDRLLFDYQRSVAEKFGYLAEDNSGVEQFMKMYYRTVSDINQLNEMLLQHFQEAIIYAKRREKIKPLNNRFQIRNDFIEVRNKNIFKHYPFALLEIFLLIQQNPGIKGVRASTIRLIRESLPLINSKFRKDIRSRSLFLEIIRQPRRVGHELRRMHRYGVLSAYLPEFGAIEGLMQFDLFHAYTADEHILFVVQNMRHFGMEEYKDKYPLCYQLMHSAIPKQELLYIAGIYHDIAKGRGGDHSELGKIEALKFCRNHQLSEFDSRLVAWLVENHLLMSKTAQREDINDPETINKFAAKVGDQMHLNYLYVLTVADIKGTSPQLWNSWKAALLAELYNKTRAALRRGLENPIDKKERLKELKEQTLQLLDEKLHHKFDIKKIWSKLGDDYFIRHSPDEIAWHTRAIAKSSEERLPLILIREMTDRGGSEIFIYMHDHDNIFSRITKTLDKLGLNILDARIITSKNNFALDTFIVLEASGETINGRERKKEIKNTLHFNLLNLDKPIKTIDRVKSRKLKNFPVPTTVRFSHDEKNSRTIMEVTATDRPGFLSAIGTALEFCGARLHNAKIATLGERIEDIFFITDRNNQMITDEIKYECLRNSIKDALTKI